MEEKYKVNQYEYKVVEFKEKGWELVSIKWISQKDSLQIDWVVNTRQRFGDQTSN